MKKNLILKNLKCTEISEMHYKSWFEAFFDYCSRTAAFSKIFSVVDVPARLLCWAPKSVMMQKWNNFAIFSKLFQVLWLYQQSIKNFAIYEEKINCGMRKKATPTLNWLYSLQQVRCVLLIRMTCISNECHERKQTF